MSGGEIVNVEITKFEYEPGGKWDCGTLNFDAKTPLGLVTWREIVPGPRHGPDSAERTLKINGNEVSPYRPGTSSCYRDFDLPDFEPPNKDGRWANEFRERGPQDVAETLGAWLEECKDHSEIQRVLALPPRDQDDEEG